eukprot:PhM_4_TR2938/c0_g1_i1/m.104006/K03260/EIF4G; translation initiation factor 4G
MAFNPDMMRSGRKKKTAAAAEAPEPEPAPIIYERATLRQFKTLFTAPPPDLKNIDALRAPVEDGMEGLSRDLMMKNMLQIGENAWQPKPKTQLTEEEEYEKYLRGMLNKLTPQKYDAVLGSFDLSRIYLSDTSKETTVRFIFEKALTEPSYSQTYVRLCRDILTAGDGDDGVMTEQGRDFRKRIIQNAQIEFETTMKNIGNGDDDGKLRKRQNTNVKFIGELFLEGVLASRVIITIVRTLLGKESGTLPDDDAIEMLCMLLTIVGGQFERDDPAIIEGATKDIQRLIDSGSYQPRIRFMLLDILETRARGWVPRVAKAGEQAPQKTQSGKSLLRVSSEQRNFTDVVRQPPTAGPKKAAPASFASAVASKRPPQTPPRMTGAKSQPTLSGSGLSTPVKASGGSSASSSKPKPAGPAKLLTGSDKEELLAALDNPRDVAHLDAPSALLTVHMDHCRFAKREEAAMEFLKSSTFQPADLVEAFGMSLSIAILEDIICDTPKFVERWVKSVTRVMPPATEMVNVLAAYARCVANFIESTDEEADDYTPLLDVVGESWKILVTELEAEPSTPERTKAILEGLHVVMQVPGLPGGVADILGRGVGTKQSKTIMDLSAINAWFNTRAGQSDSAKRLVPYFS